MGTGGDCAAARHSLGLLLLLGALTVSLAGPPPPSAWRNRTIYQVSPHGFIDVCTLACLPAESWTVSTLWAPEALRPEASLTHSCTQVFTDRFFIGGTNSSTCSYFEKYW